MDDFIRLKHSIIFSSIFMPKTITTMRFLDSTAMKQSYVL